MLVLTLVFVYLTPPATTLPSLALFPFPLFFQFLLLHASLAASGNSEISLLKLTWGQCASTAMSACLKSWNAVWPDVSAMAKTARKNLLSVCRVILLYNPPLRPLVGAISAFLFFFFSVRFLVYSCDSMAWCRKTNTCNCFLLMVFMQNLWRIH